MTHLKIVATIGVFIMFAGGLLLSELIYKREIKNSLDDEYSIGYWHGHRNMYRISSLALAIVGSVGLWIN